MSGHREELERLLREGPPSPEAREIRISENDARQHAAWCARVHGLAALMQTDPSADPPVGPCDHRWKTSLSHYGDGRDTQSCYRCGLTRRVA